MINLKKAPIGTIVLFFSFILLLAVIFLIQQPTQKNIPKDLIAVLRPHTTLLKPFNLIDHNEQDFTKNNLKNKWSFVFFGYTNCPDICPTTLFTLKQINEALKNDLQAASNIQFIFVSIDPERDKSNDLKKYVTYFNKDFIAVTGTADNINSFAKQFSAAYIKEKTNIAGEYLMSHASSIFLVDPKTRLVASFSPPHNSSIIKSQYLKIHNMF